MNLFLVSTHFNALIAAAVALQIEGESQLLFIDQKKPIDLKPYAALSMFSSVAALYVDAGSKLQAQRSRKENLTQIAELVAKHHYHKIFTGNDRRIEFQYAMYRAQQCNSSVEGGYLDDGIFTYMGMQKSALLDSISFCIKKLIWGSWIVRPERIAASAYVSSVYVLFPQLLARLLPNKRVVPVERVAFNQVLQQLGNSTLIPAVDKPRVIVLLPYFSAVSNSFVAGLNQLLLEGDDYHIVLKLHPRDKASHWQGKFNFQVDNYLTENMAFELLVNQLQADDLLLTGASSVVLTAHYLRPEIKVLVMESYQAENAVHQLFQSLNAVFISSEITLHSLYNQA